jgi:protein tyrosine/serine phosphatase
MRSRRRAAHAAALAAAALATLGLAYLGMAQGFFRGPYPPLGKRLAWALGTPGPAYNFGVVVPGQIFRSARPDARFLAWLVQEHGVQHVLSLAGESEVHVAARALGLEVTSFRWRVEALPPEEEMRAALDLISSGERVLVHCASGADRTGYTVAAHRVLREGWPTERALAEMRRYWHKRERHPEVEAGLLALFAPGGVPRAG